MALLLKNLLFTLVVPATAAVYVPLLLLGLDRSTTSGLRFVLAVALLSGGALTYLWCVWDFATAGRGTPLPLDAPKKLVIRGLYRYTRNPMYVGLVTVLLGWTLLFEARWLLAYTAGFGLIFHLFVVLYEEPHLRKIFGSDYKDYCDRVGRWLPGVRRAGALHGKDNEK